MSLSRTSMQKLVDAGVVEAVKTMGGHRRILRSSLMMKVPGLASQLRQTVPAASQRHAESNLQSMTNGLSSAPLTVLIVEDEESLADPLAYLLRKEGFEVAVATDGPSALAEFDRTGADIVLLDLMLPDGRGLDFLRARRGVGGRGGGLAGGVGRGERG